MQDNQIISTVQLDVTIDHTSILLRMVEHTRRAMIAEHVKDKTVLIEVQPTRMPKQCNNLNNRGPHHRI
jgi:hypothetical protein